MACHLYIFMRCLLRSFACFVTTFLVSLLSFELFVYFWITVLDQISFADASSQPVVCLFIFTAVSFAEQTSVMLIKSYLSGYSFMNFAFGVKSKKMSLNMILCLLNLLIYLSEFCLLCLPSFFLKIKEVFNKFISSMQVSA
jgi:hypothetical protein